MAKCNQLTHLPFKGLACTTPSMLLKRTVRGRGNNWGFSAPLTILTLLVLIAPSREGMARPSCDCIPIQFTRMNMVSSLSINWP